jgi:large subunit ribosomal protein L6
LVKPPSPFPAASTSPSTPADVTVKGPKGSLSQPSWCPADHRPPDESDTSSWSGPDDERQNRSLHGLFRSLVNNMVVGVTDGFRKELEIVGVGYRAEAKGPRSRPGSSGFSHPVLVDAPEGISSSCPQPDRIESTGIDKAVVGQVAANIRSMRKPEPYKGKGVRYQRACPPQGRQRLAE